MDDAYCRAVGCLRLWLERLRCLRLHGMEMLEDPPGQWTMEPEDEDVIDLSEAEFCVSVAFDDTSASVQKPAADDDTSASVHYNNKANNNNKNNNKKNNKASPLVGSEVKESM